jgi:tetratricopeptide (TPR) repeat protein
MLNRLTACFAACCFSALLLVCILFPAAAADCDFSSFRKKYIGENGYEYKYRKSLRVEFAPLAENCVDAFEPGELSEIVFMLYSFGLIDYAKPFGERLVAITEPEEDQTLMQNAFIAHARVTGDLDVIHTLLRVLRSKYDIEKKDLSKPKGSSAFSRYRYIEQTHVNLDIIEREIAQLYLLLGDSDKAVSMYENIMDRQPAFSYTPAMLAAGYLETGRLERAEFFAKYSLGQSNYFVAQDALIRSYIYRGNTDAARRFADKMELNESLKYFYHFFAGWFALMDDEFEDAYSHFEVFYRETPCVRDDYSRLDMFRAVELFFSLYNDNEESLPDEETMNDMAWNLLEDEDYEQSAAYYTLLSMKFPLESLYHYQLGYIYETMGLRIDSIAAYSLYLFLEPDAEERESIEDYFVSMRTRDDN